MQTGSRSLSIAALGLILGVMTPQAVLGQIQGSIWTPIGPSPINGFFQGGVVGRATSVTLNPFNGEQAWLGTSSGGLWFTWDGGAHWAPLSDDQAALAISEIAVRGCDPFGCSQVLAGTGENAIRRDTFYGRGLLIGDRTSLGPPPVYTWTMRAGWPDGNFNQGSINDVVINPFVFGGGPIYVTLSRGVTASATQVTFDAPLLLPGGYGVYRSDPAGTVWTKLNIPGSEGAEPTDLEMDPEDDQILYAGFMGRGVFRTHDGGNTWCPLSQGIPLPPTCRNPQELPDFAQKAFDWVEIAVAPSDGLTLYVTLGHCADEILNRCRPSIYRSTNGGNTWDLMQPGDSQEGNYTTSPYGYSRYTHLLEVHPLDPDAVYIGGLRLWRTLDGFATASTLADKNKTTGPSLDDFAGVVHFDHHDLAFDPADPRHMYETNDGGVYTTRDYDADGWTPRNQLTLQITGFQSLTAGPGVVLGGTQDNSVTDWHGTVVWTSQQVGGDGGATVVDAVDPKIWYAIRSSSGIGDVTVSNGGGQWCTQTWGIPGLPGNEPREMYPPLVQDPSPPHHLYWGGQSLWRSPRANAQCGNNISWVPVSPHLETGVQAKIPGGRDALTAIALAPSMSGRIYIGYHGGGLYRTDGACNQSTCWTNIGAGIPDWPITRIAVHPTLPGTVFVTLAGFDPTSANVWKTTDHGTTWNAAVTNLPVGVPANTVHFEPGHPDRLWLGLDGNPTRSPVWKSVDGGAIWNPFSSGLPNVPVFDIALAPTWNNAFAGTHGRGAFILGSDLVLKKEWWDDALPFALSMSGWKLKPDAACVLEIALADGSVCASSDTDARGASLRTDTDGRLLSNLPGKFTGRGMAWACFDGTCAGDAAAGRCQDPETPPARLTVICDGQAASVDLAGPSVGLDPPTADLTVDVQPDPGGMVVPGSFDLTPVLYAGDGATTPLCTVHVDVGAGEDNDAILARAQTALENSPTCQAAGLVATVSQGSDGMGGGEDDFPSQDRLHLTAPQRSGTRLVPAVHAAPGQSRNLCFSLFSLFTPVVHQGQGLEIQFLTDDMGARGGDLTLSRNSALGSCAMSVPMPEGGDAAAIAASVVAAFDAPGAAGPNPHCLPDENPRDVTALGDTVTITLADELKLCTSDDGIGYRLRPLGVPGVHPAAVAQVALFTECTGAGGATVLLDGSASTDPDSTPGTNDGITLFEWFENYGMAGQTLLGSSEQIGVILPIGNHAITLRVTDASGLVDTNTIAAAVVDTTPPLVSGAALPDILFPPNHELIPVMASVSATDLCGPSTIIPGSAVSDEPDDLPGFSDGATTADIRPLPPGTSGFGALLRAERDSNGDGRAYALSYLAVDGVGNLTSVILPVQVPLDLNGVVEPVMIDATETPSGTVLQWTPVSAPAGVTYNVVRGLLGQVTDLPDAFDMGPVQWVEYASPDADSANAPDTDLPLLGHGFFYLVEYVDSQGAHGYSGLGLKPRVVNIAPPANP